MSDGKAANMQPTWNREIAPILATAYLRLLAKHGPNWRERLELRTINKVKDSRKKSSIPLDLSANKSIRCTGQRTVTLTLTRS